MSDEIKNVIFLPDRKYSILTVDSGKETDHWPFNLLPIEFYINKQFISYKFKVVKNKLIIPKDISKNLNFSFTGYLLVGDKPNDRMSGYRKVPDQYDFVHELRFINNELIENNEILNDPSNHGFPPQDKESIMASVLAKIKQQEDRKLLIKSKIKGKYKFYNLE